MSGLHQTGPRVPSGNWETGTNLPEVSLGSGRRESEVSAQNSYDYHHKLFGKNSPPYHWEENPCVEAEMTTMYVDLETDFFYWLFLTEVCSATGCRWKCWDRSEVMAAVSNARSFVELRNSQTL